MPAKGQSQSPEARAKISAAKMGHAVSEETRQLWSTQRKGRTAWNKGLETGPLDEEHRKAISEGNKGKVGPWAGKILSFETRKKMSVTRKGRKFSEQHVENLVASYHAFLASKKPTSLEEILYIYLEFCGYEVVRQQRFGRYIVDAYVPAMHTAFEADGEYWHKDSGEKDQARDAWLLENYNLPVIRFTETEIKTLSASTR